MEGLIEEVFGKEFIVKADGNKFKMIAKDYYDEMTKSTNTIDVVLNEDAHIATIMYRIENVANIPCHHMKEKQIECKFCTDMYCKICGVEGCCNRHRPYVFRESGKNVTIYGYPEHEVYLRAIYFRDVLGLNVEARPFGSRN